MRDLDVRLPRRVVGRQALERRVRSLLIAVHRFGRCRARTHEELVWTARAVDGLTALLRATPVSLTHSAQTEAPR